MASPPQQAERITLVCLHSGLFTRDQVEAFFGYAKSSANRLIQALVQTRISHKPIGDHHRRPPDLPHLRQADLRGAGDPLSSLDFVLDHPELAWLLTEEEKVACFQQLGIDRAFLPCRVYSGHAEGQVRYFPLRLSVAMGPEACPLRAENPALDDSILSTIDVYEPRIEDNPFFLLSHSYGFVFRGRIPYRVQFSLVLLGLHNAPIDRMLCHTHCLHYLPITRVIESPEAR